MTGAAGIVHRVSRATGWAIGVGLIGVGLLGMAGGSGFLWLVTGILVTPRTRRELYELCEIWVESRAED